MTPIPGRSLAAWQQGIDGAPIDRSSRPSSRLVGLARASEVVCASPLRRSLESAAILRADMEPLVDILFREVYLPTAITSAVRLPPKLWVFQARMRWYAGWSPGVETYDGARRRAVVAAGNLEALAAEHQRVLLIGHGIFNGLIARALHQTGWRGPRFRPRRFWAFGVYQRTDEGASR